MLRPHEKMELGSEIPDIELEGDDGQRHNLRRLGQGQWLVLFFYPKDHTPGCTQEACSFRDAYAVFQQAGAIVAGVSADTVASHRGFSSKHSLPFRLLSDADGAARKAFGVKKTMGLLPGRETFVIDGKGVLRHRFSSQLRAKAHVDEALRFIQGNAASTAS